MATVTIKVSCAMPRTTIGRSLKQYTEKPAKSWLGTKYCCVTDFQCKSTRTLHKLGHWDVCDNSCLFQKSCNTITDVSLNISGFNTGSMYQSPLVVMTTHQPIRTGDVVEHGQSHSFLEAQLLVIRRHTVTQCLHKPVVYIAKQNKTW